MATKEGAPSPEHQELVGYLAKWIIDEGFKIECANYSSYSPCESIDSEYIPDARGYRTDTELRCYGESKTENDIDNSHSRGQFQKFAGRIMTSGKSKDTHCPFYITIPTGSEEVLKTVLKELDLADKPHVKWKSFTV